MSFTFGERSEYQLRDVHPELVTAARAVLRVTPIDFTVFCGRRTLDEQQALYAQGRTAPGRIVTDRDGVNKRSKHQDGLAIDVAPWPIQWEGKYARERFYWLAGAFLATANNLGIELKWGGDWDGDGSFADQRFDDLPHFELLEANG